jgi:hypothetical protein
MILTLIGLSTGKNVSINKEKVWAAADQFNAAFYRMKPTCFPYDGTNPSLDPVLLIHLVNKWNDLSRDNTKK